MKENTLVYGVDVGGTTIKFGLLDGRGNLLHRSSIPTDTSEQGKNILPQIAHWIRWQDVPFREIAGVGLGVPGPVRPDGTVNRCVNLGWGVVPAAAELSQLLDGVPVRVANDANAAALGERWLGAGRNMDSLLLVTLGTGVGGGIIADGKVFKGFNSAAGELGHIVIAVDGRPCTCGRRGCWEAYSSATGLIRTTEEKLAECKAIGRETKMTELVAQKGKVTGRTAFDGKRLGDAAACEVVDEYIKYLASGLASMINIFQPEVLSIGGGISNEGQYLLDLVVPEVRRQQYGTGLVPQTDIRIAKLRNDAGIIGAAVLGM